MKYINDTNLIKNKWNYNSVELCARCVSSRHDHNPVVMS